MWYLCVYVHVSADASEAGGVGAGAGIPAVGSVGL